MQRHVGCLTHLLWGAADEGAGVQQGVQLAQDRGEVRVSLDSGQQVIVASFLFHYSRRLLGQNPDLLVAVLEGNKNGIPGNQGSLKSSVFNYR